MADQLPESNVSVHDRIRDLIVAADANCTPSELVASIEVMHSVIHMNDAA